MDKLYIEGETGYHEDGHSMDIPRIRSWLRLCEEKHERCRLLPYGTKPSIAKLTVIDVELMCLTEQAAPRYFALSYVWGTGAVFRAVSANVERLKIPGELEKLGNQIPLVIRDVFLLMRRLGERYLWVDSLCIVQDCEDMKLKLIGKMDIIYAEAACTIVAHGSFDANSAIPGIRQGTRRPYRVTASNCHSAAAGIQNEMIVCSPCDYTQFSTAYDTRAWTFQEQLLSRRRLVFGADEAFFSCQSQDASDWCEEPLTYSDREAKARPSKVLFDTDGSRVAFLPNLNPDLTGMADTTKTRQALMSLSRLVSSRIDSKDKAEMFSTIFFAYTSAVTHYTGRHLTCQSDILKAFSGILSTIERTCDFGPDSTIYGLLGNYLFYCLNWVGKAVVRRPGWPSWSWIGWESQAFFLERHNPAELAPQINEAYLVDRGEVRTFTLNSEASAANDNASISQVSAAGLSSSAQLQCLSSHSPDLPALAFWGQVTAPGALQIRFHPTRRHQVRLWASREPYHNICGHMHEKYDLDAKNRPTDAEFDQFRLVYLSHSSRRCVYHIYKDVVCGGSCNSLVVAQLKGPALGSPNIVYCERVGMAEVCGTAWKDVVKTREFVALV
ncbi:heterokaryon incompatibility protein [Grosmannia clavigera kw1407]|uniref:Heterokaryon incompatibility protein n=1 Tax=Grosmannia clavigera (strain kw1407 / UAMH 11150) TaxID=655863 RepID=F0XMP6_GROCL|nr:heterokaryon incompatibility protein [Grosmannia clavigera kw1407]EFX01529.1 heterokaryon incompatibility protein [Grosmannia clavigera kw1407]